MYMMLRVHILSKKVTYIKLKVIGCSPHPIHEYFKVTSLLLTLVKSSENGFIFLPAFYLIMCLLKAKKNFEK